MKDERRWRALDSVSWLDVKLGVRMLAKHPGLSSVAVLGMALAIAIGAGCFAFLGAMLDSTLPLPSVVAVMFTVGLLATLGPARRGLAVQPTEALRGD